MKALYRRYRPRTLDDVVGQEQVTEPLKKALASNRIGHAYLFIGPRGTGKTSVARILAHEINHFDYELEDDYLDIIEIDAASNTGVDNIRELREKAIIAPTKGKYKVYIIDEVHMLSKSAFNALLKTLEEPPEHVIFIMATTDAYKVPITITSRSQTLVFKLANPATMFAHLQKIAKTEGIKISDDALKIVVKRGGGSYRDSLSLLDQVSTLSDDEISADMLNRALGLPQDEVIEKILQAYAAGDNARIREQLLLLDNINIKASMIIDSLINAILADPQNIHLGLLDKLTDIGHGDYPEVKLLLALTAPAAPAQSNYAMPINVPQHQASPAPQSHRPAIASTPTPSKIATPTPITPAPTTPATPNPTPSPAVAPDPVSKTPPASAEAEVELPDDVFADEPSIPDFAPKMDTPNANASAPAAPITHKVEAMNADNFDINQFREQCLASFRENAPAATHYLEESEFERDGNHVYIYANKKFNKTQLMKKLQLIAELLPMDFEAEIKAETKQNDAELASIAAIMGGGEEVNINE